MSADNGIYILMTRDKFKQVIDEGRSKGVGYPVVVHENQFDAPTLAYRVAHSCAIDNFNWYKENELHNLGWWMNEIWGNSNVLYSKAEAVKLAEEIESNLPYTEYGICFIDATEFNFPGY